MPSCANPPAARAERVRRAGSTLVAKGAAGRQAENEGQGGRGSHLGLMGLDSIVEYDWTVAVGDTTLSAKEFENLVRLKIPLVKVRGQWVELRPEEIEKAIAFLKKKHSNGQMSLGEALRTGLGREQSEVGLPVVDIEAEGWIQ